MQSDLLFLWPEPGQDPPADNRNIDVDRIAQAKENPKTAQQPPMSP